MSKADNITELDLICEYFSQIERQGPGSAEITAKALSFIENISASSKIIDIGCGTGGQTKTLAEKTKANIIGIDSLPKFISLFNKNMKKIGVSNRVEGIVGFMENMQLEENEYDLIWSEGAIYNIGFEYGLNEWYKFLKKGAYISVSELSWLTNKRPVEIDSFWNNAYSGIDTISNKIAQMQNAGYIPVASFVIPETCWIDSFYMQQVRIQELLQCKYPENKLVMDFVEKMKQEFELYSKYKEFYGYVFYIGKKV